MNAGIWRFLPFSRSKVGKRTSSAGTNCSGSMGPASLFVYRTSALRSSSSTNTSRGDCALSSDRPSFLPVRSKAMRPISPVGQRRQALAASGDVQHGEAALAVDVRHPREVLAVVAARERVDVPGYVRRQYLHRAAAEIDAPQLLELAVPVGDQVDTAAVRRELRLRHTRRIVAFAHRRERSGGDVHHVQVRFVGRDEVVDEQAGVVGRPVRTDQFF